MADTVIKHPQAMLQLRLSNFSVAYQGIPAVVNLSLTLTAATVNLVTGVIGAGKTTLLKALSGMIGHTGSIELTEGARRFGADGAGALLEPLAHSPISVLTPEQYRLAEVAQLFVQQPRVILLDEPSRCLSAESATSVLTCISKWVRDTRNIAVVAAEGVIPAANVDRILTLERGKLMNA